MLSGGKSSREDFELISESDGAQERGFLSLREIQLAALEILRQVDVICREEGLRYWLWYGSLIGAVRHGGFVPWDDDLDIVMPREDYEMLLGYFGAHANELSPLVVVNDRTNAEIPYRITRLCDTTYRMVGEFGRVDDRIGAFVDVYPLDGAGSNLGDAFDLKARAFDVGQRFIHASNFAAFNARASGFKRVLKALRSKLLGDPSGYAQELRRLCSLYPFEGSDYVAVLAWVESNRSPVYERSLFDRSIEVDFEGVSAKIPVGYDEILRSAYGNYMKLPPPEERLPHHSYKLVERPVSRR